MEPKLKILMLEDLVDDAGLIERSLKKGGLSFVMKRVDSREEFTAALSLFKPDTILSDHALPQFNSIEALKICKELNLDVPFILVTGTVSEEFAVNCIKQGVDDYVLKSNLTRLPSSIHTALAIRESIRKKRQAESAIRKQNEELVKINRELDAFVYSVSHNLRAPLASVLGLVNLAQLEDRQMGGNFAKYLNMMEHSVMKLDETLRQILDYSRNTRTGIKIAPVDLEKLLKESFERFQYLEGMDTIDKKVLVDKESEFNTDAYRFSIIVNNLISNAIKYRDKNKSSKYIKIHAIVTPEQLEFTFSDNGIGIHEERVPMIFDMFYRGTEKSEGAGLGLYIVREMVERLDGEISVTSRLDEGTTFNLRLPNIQQKMSTPENILIDAG